MTWRNAQQLAAEYSDPEYLAAFGAHFSLSRFLANGIVGDDYSPGGDFTEYVTLTEYGEKWAANVRQRFTSISPSELSLALYVEFYHSDLFIDPLATNQKSVEKFLDDQVTMGKLVHPWVYGRILYDRFFDLFPDATKTLTYDQARSLLEGTPSGVFQLQDYLVGPFGLLRSSQRRELRPMRSLPLWHCSDLSCSALHPVHLQTGHCSITDVTTFLRTEAAKVEGPASEWAGLYSHHDLDGSPSYFDDLHTHDIPGLLGNGFTLDELRLICENLLDSDSKAIRERLPDTKRVRTLMAAPPAKIVQSLDLAQALQMILLGEDHSICKVIDSLVDAEKLHIPPTEIRNAGTRPRSGSWFSMAVDCSRLGLRTVSYRKRSSVAFARLRRLVTKLYASEPKLGQLEWKLRHVDGQSLFEKLDSYLHNTEPSVAVSSLVFADPECFATALGDYGIATPHSPIDETTEQRLIEKLLWKLGFDVKLYPEHNSTFWRRHEALLATARTDLPYSERDKEAIRSAAVNFFVSLEEILDHSLSFSSWALFSDHYKDTQFEFSLPKARKRMAGVLDGREITKDAPLRIDANGLNTLYPLIEGFAQLSMACKEHLEMDASAHARADQELPGFHQKTELDLFPFVHTILLLDLRAYDQQRIIDLLHSVARTLEQAGICDIRNRLEHKREDFPVQEQIETALDAAARCAEKLERSGLYPKVSYHRRSESDHHRRTKHVFQDYKGSELILNSPSQYRTALSLNLNAPLIIVPSMTIGESTDLIRFVLVEESPYVQLWENYPRRRSKVPRSTPPNHLSESRSFENQEG